MMFRVTKHQVRPHWRFKFGRVAYYLNTTISLQYLVPGVAQVVAISVSHSDEGFDGVDVLLLHFCDARAGCQQSETCQGLDVCISLQLLHGHNTK